MTDPNFILLYVTDAIASADFYSALLGKPPVDVAPTFALFALDSGVKLGLWTRDGVQPAATAAPGAGELAFAVADEATVNACHADWSARGLTIAQAPTTMDFGTTFVALDPDGHRLRVFTPSP